MTPLRLERLERRDNPAGTVTATLVGTTWTLVGDAEANHITIDPLSTPGSFVLGGIGTEVAGDTAPAGVRNVVVKLGGGDDQADVNFNGPLRPLAGNLTIDGGDGANTLNVVNLSIGGNVSVRNGTNRSDGTDEDFIGLENSSVAGSVTIRNGDGDSDTRISRSTAGDSPIGGNLTVVNGIGNHRATTSDIDVGGNVSFTNGAQGTGGISRFVGLTNLLNTGPSAVGGNVRIRYASGARLTNDFVRDVVVGGSVSVDYGTANGRLAIESNAVNRPPEVLGSVTVKGLGDVNVLLGDGTFNNGAVIGKNLLIDARGAASVGLLRVAVGGKTAIVTGGGADTVTIDDCSFRAFSLSTGGGSDTVNVEQRTDAAGAGVTVFRGKSTLKIGDGAADVVNFGVAAEAGRQVEVFAPFKVTATGATTASFANVFDPLDLFTALV